MKVDRYTIQTNKETPHSYDFYCPKNSGPHPLICMTPILGRLIFFEDLFWERRIARFFANKGYAVLLVHRPIFEFDHGNGLLQIRHYLDESVERNKRTLDHILKSSASIDLNRIGSFGISFGAVVNSLWAGTDSRLKVNVLALGGGNIARICMTSRDPLMMSYVKAAKMSSQLPDDQLEKKLQEIFSRDPLDCCHSLSTKDTMLIIALFDRVVRLKFALSLYHAIHKPKTLFLPLGHYTTLLAMPYLKQTVLRFFNNRFSQRSNQTNIERQP